MPPGLGQLVGLGKVCGARIVSRGDWPSLAGWRTAFFPSSNLQTAEAPLPQVENLTQASYDFVAQLRTICDSVLYAYFSKTADTADKRRYLHDLYKEIGDGPLSPLFKDFNTFLDYLDKSKIFGLQLSIFHPYDLRVLLNILYNWSLLSFYFKNFRSDPERSKEFYYKDEFWDGFAALRYMQ